MDARPVSHPTDQTLSSYGLGKLDDASQRAVDDHLEHCPACRNRVAELSADSFLGRIRDARVQGSAPDPAVSSTEGLSTLEGRAASPAPRRRTRSRRAWLNTPTMRFGANWAAVAWESSIWPRIR